jgi:hypothetical protein
MRGRRSGKIRVKRHRVDFVICKHVRGGELTNNNGYVASVPVSLSLYVRSTRMRSIVASSAFENRATSRPVTPPVANPRMARSGEFSQSSANCARSTCLRCASQKAERLCEARHIQPVVKGELPGSSNLDFAVRMRECDGSACTCSTKRSSRARASCCNATAASPPSPQTSQSSTRHLKRRTHSTIYFLILFTLVTKCCTDVSGSQTNQFIVLSSRSLSHTADCLTHSFALPPLTLPFNQSLVWSLTRSLTNSFS